MKWLRSDAFIKYQLVLFCAALFISGQFVISWYHSLWRVSRVRSDVNTDQIVGRGDYNDISLSEPCPMPYRRTECSIKMSGFMMHDVTRHSGSITVNQRQVSEWNNSRGIVLSRIGNTCDSEETVKFDIHDVKGFAEYVSAQPADTLLIGMSSDHNMLRNSVTLKVLKGLGAPSGAIMHDCIYGLKIKIGYTGLTELWKKQRPEGNFSVSITVFQGSRIPVHLTEPSEEELEKSHTEVKLGGHWRPPNCKAHSKIAIIIPFRDRHPHLRILLNHMVPFLMKQNADFTFYIIEQAGNTMFNRAMMMNVGYTEAKQRGNYDCYIFHDVDLLPEDISNLYACADRPMHFSVSISKTNYKAPYPMQIGGVAGLTSAHIESVNGYTNMYFAWGGEDDEFAYRLLSKGISIQRPPREIAKYTMIKHRADNTNPWAGRNSGSMKHHAELYMTMDGLNSLEYKRLSVEQHPLYTNITVTIEGPTTREEIQPSYDRAMEKLKNFTRKENQPIPLSSNTTRVDNGHFNKMLAGV